MDSQLKESIEAARAAVGQADALLIAAGAGMGVDSGLPDFRGTEGFWRAYPAIAKLGIRFEEMANPEWFQSDPALAWAFYGHRLNLYRGTTPHAGFGRLLAYASKKPGGYFVFTANVDGHFQKAGYAADRIVECHGSIHHFQCCRPCQQSIWDAVKETVEVDVAEFRAKEPLPKCRLCSILARPNVLMFGDPNWVPGRSAQQENRLRQWLAELQHRAHKLAIVEFGAGTAVPSVRHLSEAVAARLGATLIRVNPREPRVPEGHIGLPLGAMDSINRIL